MAKPYTTAPNDNTEPASDVPTPMGRLMKAPECANSPRTIKKTINVGIHDQNSYKCTTLYPKRVICNQVISDDHRGQEIASPYQEGTECNDDDARPAWNIVVDGIDELCADNDVDRRPSYTGENVEDGNYTMYQQATSLAHMKNARHILSLTPHHPNQNLDKTIWRRPKAGPKQEKKQTVMMPNRLKKRTTRMASTKPR